MAMTGAGRLQRADEVVASARALSISAPELYEAIFWLEYLRGDVPAALRALDDVPGDLIVGQLPYTPTALLRGYLFDAYGGDADAQYAEALRQLEPAAQARPWDPRVWLAMANAHAGLGNVAEAHDAMRRVNELYPVDRDHMLGPDILRHFARIHVMLGEHDDAIAVLQRVRARPSKLTRYWLEHDPLWQPVRADPRFVALLGR
jgi:tetratricopeptide (TPR) repeat protein